MEISAPYLPYDKLRVVGEKFLADHHPGGDLPVPIERIVEFKLSIDIVPMPGLKDEFDVDAFITNDLSEIRVDRFIQARRPARYHFSLAHEVAHLLVHQDIFRALSFKTIQQWKETICAIPEDEYSWIEWQAYALAGLILVPTAPLKALFEDSISKARRAGLNPQTMDRQGKHIIESSIGKHFAVSADVIERRLGYEKLWA